ncbi:MAG TPA: AraC family transcriptional regulator [Anaerolineales bacterium]|nr:AraC family transcriptional regulator [Anaerolineales bacterium]
MIRLEQPSRGLSRDRKRMSADARRPLGHAERVDAVKRFVRLHTDESLDRERLAAVAGFSVPHFHRVFQAGAGENIAGYVRRIRLERAGRKLRMRAVSITQVALDAGYDKRAAFGKVFKQHFDLSPSEFRRLDCRRTTRILRKG